VALLYNYTEASFYGINGMWVAFLFSCLDARDVRVAAPAPAIVATGTVLRSVDTKTRPRAYRRSQFSTRRLDLGSRAPHQ
jgi:hypothetical protein